MAITVLFYHIQGKITESWLAETKGIFFLIMRALLVIKRAWLLNADWLSMPACQMDTEKEFQKCITSELDLNMVTSSNVKENWHAAKPNLLVEK